MVEWRIGLTAKKTDWCKEPFAARLDMEVINAPSPVKTSRNNENLYEEGECFSITHSESIK